MIWFVYLASLILLPKFFADFYSSPPNDRKIPTKFFLYMFAIISLDLFTPILWTRLSKNLGNPI